LTAVTVQNSTGVSAVFDLPPDLVAQQIDAVLDDLGADAIKIGMLSTAAVVEAVGDRLAAHGERPVVLDPVMVATSGDALMQDGARGVLVKRLLPLATLVTPNLHEAAALADMDVAGEADMEEAARRIVALGARRVLVKGGHLAGSATDLLWNGRTLTRFTAPRIATGPTHGTGCTLSAAIAAGLAHGRALEHAVREAKAYVTAAMREGFAPGRGAGVLRHFVTDW
jgi:hydroxymethylpyrimidine/phosphomethylpyrimidine kinase